MSNSIVLSILTGLLLALALANTSAAEIDTERLVENR